MSDISTIDELIPAESITAPGRGNLSPARLEEHLHITVKRLKKFGIHQSDRVASALPEGPDATTLKLAHANFAPLAPSSSREHYESLLLEIDPKLMLIHPGAHPAREAAHSLGIPVANVLRHFEAGVFTLEAALTVPKSSQAPLAPYPSWKSRSRGVPLVLISPGLAYRRLANRLDAGNPVIGITPPGLEHLPLPHTIEHIAAECVRMLRRYRPQGPYALAGWQAEGLVALEMARLLEEAGEKIAFVAMLDASALFRPAMNPIRRLFSSVARFLRKKQAPSCEFMAEALRQYRPHPWYGKIIHIEESVRPESNPRFEWRNIAPHGFASYEATGETFAEILAGELNRPA